MDDPESWRWIWLILTVLFFLGEMLAPGTFFLAPFGAGAAVALLLSLAGLSPVISFIAFLTVSFWAIFYSRVGLRVGGVTAFATLMIYFLWRCWERPPTEKWFGLVDGALAGLFLAAGVYTYLAGRVLP